MSLAYSLSLPKHCFRYYYCSKRHGRTISLKGNVSGFCVWHLNICKIWKCLCEEIWDPCRECSFVFAIPRFEPRRLKRPRWLWGQQRIYRSYFPVMTQPGVMLTTNVHLLLRLRMSGAIPLLPLCAFMAGTGSNLPVYHRPYTGLSPDAGNIAK